MTFTVHVEHEVIGAGVVLEKFEGVTEMTDPPMTDSLHLKFTGEQDSAKLQYGNIVRITDD